MKNTQVGSTVVEFAFVLLIFLMFFLGILDFSRMLFTWNAAAEATRSGARYAVVCDDTTKQAVVLSKMQKLLPQISSINLAWAPAGCNSATCEGVTVTITGLNYKWISPIPGSIALAAIPMPGFSTYLPREIMGQDPNSSTICP